MDANGREREPEAGEMLRPTPEILDERAIVPDRNVIRPPPDRFTHELVADAPYHFDPERGATDPDGVLAAGTPVALLVEGSDLDRVVDGKGLYVAIAKGNLRQRSP